MIVFNQFAWMMRGSGSHRERIAEPAELWRRHELSAWCLLARCFGLVVVASVNWRADRLTKHAGIQHGQILTAGSVQCSVDGSHARGLAFAGR